MGTASEAGPTSAPPRRGARLLFGVVLPLVFLLALAWFVWSERGSLSRLWEAPPGDLLLIAGLFALGHLLNSTEFWLLYAATGARIGLLENWMLFTGGQLANHLPGQVGTIYRLRYMRAVHQVPYLTSAAVYGANLVITLEAAALVGLVGVFASAGAGRPLSLPMVLVFGSLAVAAALFAAVPLPALHRSRGRLGEAWRRFHSGFEEIRRLPRTAVLVALLEVVKYAVTAWRIQVTFSLIGIQQPFWFFLVLAPAAGIASFIAVTPGALGFREAFVTGAAAAMGLEASAGLLGATVDRGIMLATFLLLGTLGLLVTYPRLRAASLPGRPREGAGEEG